jgi:hypothetical protein
MLRITTLKTQMVTTLRVEGKLVGPWVGELQGSWRSVSSEPANGRLCVDLTDVTFVDEEGKRLLEVMYAEGVKLKASGCVTRRLVEEIERSLHRTPIKNGALNPK